MSRSRSFKDNSPALCIDFYLVVTAGIDVPFEDWPMKTSNSPIYASHAMECGRQTYKGLSDIVDMFASDQQLWSGKFLEAWDLMATNGYTSLRQGPGPGWFTDLEEAPQAGWLGHYSLDKAGRLGPGDSLESLIAQAGEAGLVWTDPEVDTQEDNLRFA